MRKAKQGKIIAGRRPNYGFKFNSAREGYEIDAEGVPTPSGCKYWHWRAYSGERMEEIIAAELEELADEERELLELLNKELRRELKEAA